MDAVDLFDNNNAKSFALSNSSKKSCGGGGWHSLRAQHPPQHTWHKKGGKCQHLYSQKRPKKTVRFQTSNDICNNNDLSWELVAAAPPAELLTEMEFTLVFWAKSELNAISVQAKKEAYMATRQD
ncbi:hypothetical protein ACA910_016392 [Epithemia clementina (nom. ined.)]